MDDNGTPAIEVESLTKDYGSLRAVDGVSFVVPRGEVFAFLGRNGAGKTTTVEIIETLRAATSGSVRVLGMEVKSRKREICRRIGVLPQGFQSFDRVTVAESIRYYAKLFSSRRADVDGLMATAGLGEHRDRLFKDLSGGLKQRVGIAIALVNDPEVILLDEPTTGLDPVARRAVWELLRGLRDKGKAVFLTTHYMEEAELLADRVAIIARGRLVALGSPAELIDRHAHHLNVTLLEAGTRVVERVRALHAGATVDRRGNVELRVRGTEDVGRLLEAIRIEGESLPGLDVRRPNLEEVFVRITEDAARPGVSGGAL